MVGAPVRPVLTNINPRTKSYESKGKGGHLHSEKSSQKKTGKVSRTLRRTQPNGMATKRGQAISTRRARDATSWSHRTDGSQSVRRDDFSGDWEETDSTQGAERHRRHVRQRRDSQSQHQKGQSGNRQLGGRSSEEILDHSRGARAAPIGG